jgi:hypothetical protein
MMKQGEAILAMQAKGYCWKTTPSQGSNPTRASGRHRRSPVADALSKINRMPQRPFLLVQGGGWQTWFESMVLLLCAKALD